jgi:hypothetical protein
MDGIHGEATGFIGGIGKQGSIHEINAHPEVRGRGAKRLEILTRLTSQQSTIGQSSDKTRSFSA